MLDRFDTQQASLAAVEQQLAAISERLDALALGQQQLIAVQAELQTRLRRTQALVARTYEALPDWPGQLDDARGTREYDAAYTDPQPLISIPIPTYHSPDTLCDRALASVRAQTYHHWEAIVVGDCCTDDTEQRVRALNDSRIRFVNLSVRESDPDDPWERYAIRGSLPRGVGIDLSRGRWIAPLSHDDEWDPDHLRSLLAEAKGSGAEVVYSRMRVVDGQTPGPVLGTVGVWPPTRNNFAWQASMFNGTLKFLRYDRASALASEFNDWNLARRAWEAGVRFHHLARETATLYTYPRWDEVNAGYAAIGRPPSAAAVP